MVAVVCRERGDHVEVVGGGDGGEVRGKKRRRTR